jgi:hypothetical protein
MDEEDSVDEAALSEEAPRGGSGSLSMGTLEDMLKSPDKA